MNLVLPASVRRLVRGELAYPLPAAAPVPWLATADLATVLADAVATPEQGRFVAVGPEALTGEQAAPAGIAGFYAAAPAAGPPPPRPAPATVRPGATTLASWASARPWDAKGPE